MIELNYKRAIVRTPGESAELLDMSHSATIAVLDYMEVTGIVQRVKRRRNFYFLKDTYDEERIETMILEAVERTKSGTGGFDPVFRRSKYDPIIDRFLESGHDLMRLDVKGKNPHYIATVLNRRIKVRELDARAQTIILGDKDIFVP